MLSPACYWHFAIVILVQCLSKARIANVCVENISQWAYL